MTAVGILVFVACFPCALVHFLLRNLYKRNSSYLLLLLVLLQKAMDSPNPEVVEDALNLLIDIRAIEKTSPRGRYEPSFYGRLLSCFTLSYDASILILKFGDIGMLREGILLGILMDVQPLPILRPFGQENLVLYLEF